jgi:dihydrofolate reductase
MRKLVQFMHVSLDGFVTGPNGEMDWIKVDDEIFEYAGHRTSESDMALYGRVTFDLMESYWPTAADKPNPSKHTIEHSAWYKKVPKVVLSKSMKGKALNNTTIISENVGEEVRKIKQSSGKEIIIFGSPSASHSLFVNPILVGKGIPMFKDPGKVNLKLVKNHVFKSGVVCLHYERIEK